MSTQNYWAGWEAKKVDMATQKRGKLEYARVAIKIQLNQSFPN